MVSGATPSTSLRENSFPVDREERPEAQRIVRQLKNLLSDLIGQSELTLMVADQDLLISGNLRQIRRASLNACALLGQLSQGVDDRARVFRTVDIGELVRQCESGLRSLLPVDSTLEVRCASEIMPVRIDPISLEHILFEFAAVSLANFDAPVAIEIEVGGPSAEVGCSQQVVISLLCSRRGETENWVGSNGHQRPDVGAKRDSAPLVLDTSAATEMILASGGSLNVEFVPGTNLSLLVTLPRSDEDLEELPVRDAAGFLPMGTETLLVVQPEPITREALCHILGAQGYTVLEAARNEEALALAGDLEPGKLALLIADSVGSMCRGASEDSELGRLQPNVRRLYTSTYIQAGEDASNLAQSHEAFVDSPFTPRSLVCKVREVLDREPD